MSFVFTIFLAAAPPCTAAQMAELTAQASDAAPSYDLRCSPALTHDLTITKKIVLKGASASGVVLDCDGGTVKPSASGGYSIAIHSSENDDGSWSRPEDITITRCIIFGSIRLYGLGTNGQGELVRLSSYSAGHTERAQAAAPRNVLLDTITLVAVGGGTPLYLAPGVTETTLRNSEIRGEHGGPAIYFDAESARNVVKDSSIHSKTDYRELVAIDGSAHNTIIKNRFSSLSNGGIYLYRNCGEGGTVRHQSPKHNTIADNVFYYDSAIGLNPSIWIGSRWGLRAYCGDDDGYPFGSSASNLDYAEDNVVVRNQIYRLPVLQMIRVTDLPNKVEDNITVHPRIPIGCGGRIDVEDEDGPIELFRGLPK